MSFFFGSQQQVLNTPLTWRLQAITGLSGYYPAVARSIQGKCIVGASGGRISYSSDGSTWTGGTVNSTTGVSDIGEYGSYIGVFLATANIGLSTNGISWTQYSIGISERYYGVYFNGKYYLIGGWGTPSIYSSSTATSGYTLSKSWTGTWGCKLCIVGSYLVAIIAERIVSYTSNGTTWYDVTLPSAHQTMRNAEVVDGVLYLLGDNGMLCIAYDPTNPSTWVYYTIGSSRIHGIAKGRGVYVIVTNGSGEMYTTENFSSFTRVAQGLTTGALSRCTFFNNKFIIPVQTAITGYCIVGE